MWNYTPYGFRLLMDGGQAQAPGAETQHRFPNADRAAQGFGAPRLLNIFWRFESPLNLLITLVGKLFRASNSFINSLKLLFCGQFIFYVTKDGE